MNPHRFSQFKTGLGLSIKIGKILLCDKGHPGTNLQSVTFKNICVKNVVSTVFQPSENNQHACKSNYMMIFAVCSSFVADVNIICKMKYSSKKDNNQLLSVGY